MVVWHESKRVHEEMVDGWMDAPPVPTVPHPTGQPYKRQVQVKLTILEGPHEDTEVLYVISSDGGTERLAELGRIAGARIGQYGTTSPYLYPVVQLDFDYYDNKQHGSRIFKPVFKLAGWADADGNMEDDGGNIAALPNKAAEPAKPVPAETTAAAGQRRRPGR